MNKLLTLASATLWAGLTVGTATSASAHIVMVGDLLSRDNQAFGDAQKMSPCDGPRANGTTYTFAPGTTITLALTEAIPHPGYFRIAFDNDGEDNFVEPASIDPIDPKRVGSAQASPNNPKCLADPNDKCGASDFCNVVSTNGGPTVLWDNLDPHINALTNLTWNVTLPDVECDNCTIQVIQVMEDSSAHGAYCPTGTCTDSSAEDIYHRCINITLKKGAVNSKGVATGPVNNKGIECAKNAAFLDAGVPGVDAGAIMGGQPNQVADAGATTPSDGGTKSSAVDGGLAAPDTANDSGGCALRPGKSSIDSFGLLALAFGSLVILRRRKRVQR